VRVYEQGVEADVKHFRLHSGEREVDLIVERDDHRVLAIEVKPATVPSDRDLRHLRRLKDAIGDDLLDAIVITTGTAAYRRDDGIGVVPLALLGP
jgi:predicted AAA+ superfamily ATPase